MKNRIGIILGGASIAAAVIIAPHASAGGSGDSPVYTPFSQPAAPSMTFGSTVTESIAPVLPTAAPSPGTPSASPTVKASPAPVCVNNGQCP